MLTTTELQSTARSRGRSVCVCAAARDATRMDRCDRLPAMPRRMSVPRPSDLGKRERGDRLGSVGGLRSFLRLVASRTGPSALSQRARCHSARRVDGARFTAKPLPQRGTSPEE